MNYIIYIFIITVIFLLYVEYSVGGIIYRVNASGIKNVQFGNIIHYLLDPLHNAFLWNKELLDVNYIFVFSIATLIYKIILNFQEGIQDHRHKFSFLI
jgi:hypothetical protein